MKRLLCLLLCLAMLPAAALGDRAYLIPDSDSRKLTEKELWEWDYESLWYVLNEIFARHGFNFDPGKPYYYYFNCMPWYSPNENPNNQEACYSQLNSTEWYNEQKIKSVLRDMKALGTTNSGAQSVWDYFSAGFDTLQGFEYIEMKSGQKLAVYSAPSKSSWRGANGKATMATSGIVYAAGWESGWLMVMYETNNGSVRVGYVNSGDIKGSVPMDTRLTFQYTTASLTASAELTDDPARSYSVIRRLPKGEQVTYLSTFFNKGAWDYIETTIDGKTVRGFIPAGCLDISDTDDLFSIGEK